MPQRLSLQYQSHNPYTEVKLINICHRPGERIMCFGEFICPETGKLEETIINPHVHGEDEILRYCVNKGDIVHTTKPRENTQAKNKSRFTKFRVNLRDIDEQPIYIQEKWKEFVEYHESKNIPQVEINDNVSSAEAKSHALSTPDLATEKVEEYTSNQGVDFKNEITKNLNNFPKTISLAKSNSRFRYIAKLASQSDYPASDVRKYSRILGDLVDFCIEHNINPYQHES